MRATTLTICELDRIADTYTALWQLASAETRLAGMTWYRTAHDTARRLAIAYDVETSVACGVLAALSPRTAWDTNVDAAGDTLARGMDARRPSGCKWQSDANMGKAVRIIAQGSTVGMFRPDSKTWAFSDNLAAPETSDRVTLDSWALRVVGLPESIEPASYRLVARAIAEAAQDLALLPHQLQATVWVLAHTLALRSSQCVILANSVPMVVERDLLPSLQA